MFEKLRSSSNFQAKEGRVLKPKAEELSFVCIASCTSPSQTTARLPTAQMIFALLIRMVMILLMTTIMLIMTLVCVDDDADDADDNI